MEKKYLFVFIKFRKKVVVLIKESNRNNKRYRKKDWVFYYCIVELCYLKRERETEVPFFSTH